LENRGLHPLIHTLLEFTLALDTVGAQVNAVEKVTPISQLPNRWGQLHAHR